MGIKMVEIEKKIAELHAENDRLTKSVTAEMTDEEYNVVESRCAEIHHEIDSLINEACDHA